MGPLQKGFFVLFELRKVDMRDDRDGGRRGGFRRDGPRRDFDRGPREMHKAVCTECGKECEVPFKPTEDMTAEPAE